MENLTEYSMNKSIDTLSEEIDELLLRKLELIEEKIRETIQMEWLLKDGYIELAKAKYICGKENIGILQVPSNTDTMISLFNLETKIMNENDDTRSCFDISLKNFNNEVNKPADPIKWFGILVPQNLKNSQQRFQESVYHAIKIANIQMQLVSVFSKLQKLYIQKNNLLCQNGLTS
ncbi:coiled-coil domain-containing protein 115-like [Odontomachus brunneus]|uniref:coiled-coil domain-containing protein 115-like n=1 Tax=Odontomachus brunneus TaxID=486640 RepID=UPI0013F1B2D5|nr:coiled-coil domain-containing protein 115-like [Odontomachus brunneus]XP_032675162.1 coiled-coil domain-containing protein 115-like [Odontomachus brunneus]